MANFDQIKAVIFDFDGTLAVLNIDFNVMRQKVFELIREFGVDKNSITEEYLLEIIDEVYRILWKKDPSGAAKFYQQAHQILHEVEIEAAEKGNLIPGAKEILKILQRKGMKVGIITRNCGAAVRKVFPDIEEFCHVFVSRDGMRRVKPHPDHLSSVMEALNISENEALMIGDHTIDIEAGKRVGIKTIGVLTGRTKREEFERAGADRILNNATEIRRLLEEP